MMSKEREKEIRAYAGDDGTLGWRCLNELLAEVDSLRAEIDQLKIHMRVAYLEGRRSVFDTVVKMPIRERVPRDPDPNGPSAA